VRYEKMLLLSKQRERNAYPEGHMMVQLSPIAESTQSCVTLDNLLGEQVVAEYSRELNRTSEVNFFTKFFLKKNVR
jgi:hypothetical protein